MTKPKHSEVATIPAAASIFAASLLDRHAIIGPSVWQPTDGRSGKAYYFMAAGFDKEGFLLMKMDGRPEERAAFIVCLTQHRPLVIQDMDDELQMARMCEALWPCDKTRRIKESLEAEFRANATSGS